MLLSSQGTLYNPVLMMCQSMQGKPSLSGSLGAGFPGEFPMYNQYLYHYCYMDPQEVSIPPYRLLFDFIQYTFLVSFLLRLLHWCWVSWWCWSCPCQCTMPTRPAARFGATAKPTSTGTSVRWGHQRDRMDKNGWVIRSVFVLCVNEYILLAMRLSMSRSRNASD